MMSETIIGCKPKSRCLFQLCCPPLALSPVQFLYLILKPKKLAQAHVESQSNTLIHLPRIASSVPLAQ